MQISYNFKAKQGPAGKRNRAARRKQERIAAYHNSRGHLTEHSNLANQMLNKIRAHQKNVSLIDDLCAEDFGFTGTQPGMIPAEVFELKSEAGVDFSGPWDHTVAVMALAALEASGKSQRAFAAEHGFPESRIRSWKKKLES